MAVETLLSAWFPIYRGSLWAVGDPSPYLDGRALTLELGQALSLPGFPDTGDPLGPILAPGVPVFT